MSTECNCDEVRNFARDPLCDFCLAEEERAIQADEEEEESDEGISDKEKIEALTLLLRKTARAIWEGKAGGYGLDQISQEVGYNYEEFPSFDDDMEVK